MSEDKPFEIGYGKPPKASQFAKGRSGNPKGRPKGSRNLASIVLRESRQLVRVNGPRGPRKMNKAELTVMQIGNKSAQGDPRAAREFISLIQWSEVVANSKTESSTSHESDQKVMQNILRRLKRAADSTSIDSQPSQEEQK